MNIRVFRAVRTMVLGTLILGVFAVVGLSVSTPVDAVAGINERINFQGRLLNHSGAAVADGYYNIEFKIYQDGDGQTAGNTTGTPAGSLKWTEDWLNNNSQGVKIRNGYFSVELGSVTPFGSSIDWNQDTLYLSINVGDTTTTCTPFSSCNGDGEMLPMKRLSATPYALNAGKLGGRTADGFIQNNAGTPQAANISIQSANAADVAAVIQGAASQTADIFQVKADSVATPLFAVSNAGSVSITPTSDSSAALTVNSTSGNIFTASATQIELNQNTNVNGRLSLSNSTTQNKYSLAVDSTSGTLNLGSAIIGSATTGTGTHSGNSGYVSSSKYNSGPGGTVDSLVIYLPTVGSAPNNHARAAIYADNAGSPGALLSSATATSTVVTAGWNTLPLGTTLTLSPNTNYWLAFKLDSDTTEFRYVSMTSAASAYDIETYGNDFPSSFTSDVSSGFAYAVYAPYISVTNQSDIPSAMTVDAGGNVVFKAYRNQDDDGTTNGSFAIQDAAGTNLLTANTDSKFIGVLGKLQVNDLNQNYTVNLVGGIDQTGGTARIYRQSTGTSEVILDLQSNVGGTAQSKFTVYGNGDTSVAGALSAATLQAASLDTATAGALDIGLTSGGNATSINLNQDTALASGKTLTVNGSGFDASGNLGVGTTSPSTNFETQVNSSTLTQSQWLLNQTGSGDASIEIKNQTQQWHVGLSSSDGSGFAITSETANETTATFGYNTIGATAENSSSTYQVCSQFTTGAGANGTISSISAYITNPASAPNNHFQVAIYSDSTGTPNALIASSNSANVMTGWNTVAISATITASTPYWLCYAKDTGASTSTIMHDTGSGSSLYVSGQTFGTWNSTFPGGYTTTTSQYSIYATYGVSGTYNTFDNKLFSLSAYGQATFKNSTDSTNAFEVQNTSGAALFTADTSNMAVSVGGDLAASGTINSVGGYQYNGTSGSATTCSAGQYLDGAVVQGGIVTGGTCVAAAGAGANTSLSNLSAVDINTALNATSNDLTLQTTTSGNVNIAPVGVINLQSNTVLAAGKTLTITGDITGNRPSASGNAGMLYFDTTTGQLLQSNGTKWVSDRTDATIVAASDSTQAAKDAADYVADGNTATANDGDQVQINDALTAAAGGKVVLLPGTYTVDAAISVPNNTTLTGVGAGTVITIPNSFNAAINVITNTDTTTGTGVTVRDLKIDGNIANNTSGLENALVFNGMGDSATSRTGGTVQNLEIDNFRNTGISLLSSDNSIVSNNIAYNNYYNIDVESSYNNTITGNNTSAGTWGIYVYGGGGHTVSGNVATASSNGNIRIDSVYETPTTRNGVSVTGNTVVGSTAGSGISVYNSLNITVSGNLAIRNFYYGIDLTYTNKSIVNGNRFVDNGDATTNNGIDLYAASDNHIADNYITDNSCTTTCYAINIEDSGSTNNYLSGNTFSGDGTNTATINDASSSTVYAGQVNGSGDYSIQPAGSVKLVANTDVTGTLTATSNLQAGSHVYGPDFDTASAGALTIGANNASSISIGKSTGATPISLSSSTIGLGVSGTDTTLLAAAQTTADTNGNKLTIQGSTGNGTGNGGTVTIQGGNGGTTNGNGGDLELYGGTGVGTGVTGLVKINTATYATAATQNSDSTTSGINTNITQANVDSYGALVVNATGNAQSFTLGDPTLGVNAIGRVVYVTAANGSNDFTLIVNGGGTGNEVAMRQNTTATMIWNGSDWTAAGASSSTTLQAAYDNTLQSAGGAELVVSKTSSTNGLTIRDSSVNPVNGRILSVQTSSAADLISINSNLTEYASDAGAEVAGGSSITFPSSTWSAISGSTVSRYTTAGNYIATGQGSVAVSTNTSAGSGVANQLTTSLTAKTTYNVSLTTRLDSASSAFTDLEVYYSVDGTTASTACTNSKVVPTSVWSKVNCTFTAPASGITSSNAILIRQAGSGTAHDFYVDNLSVTIAADYNYATDGSVNDGTNFSTNWPAVGGSTVTRDQTTGNDASDSAKVVTTAAGDGVSNKLSINPLTSTLYRVTVYAHADTSSFSTFKVSYTRDNGTNFADCADYNTDTVTTDTSYTKITCYIQTDSTAATNPYVYFTQTDATGRTFYIDTFSMTLSTVTTPNVQIGGGINGGPTTLFTLDRGASAPIASDNDALLGSMYYDTTLGKLQCYEADGWGACGSSPDNIITISPEYTNAVLHGPSGGTTGIGTMTSDFCSDYLNINDGSSGQDTICGTNETYNFYKWTSPQATAQTYAIYVTYQLPDTFKQFASGQTSIMGRTDNGPSSGTASVSYKVFRNSSSGLTQCATTPGTDNISVSSGTVSSWQTGTATGAQDPSTCGFVAGDSIVFEIDVSAYQNANAYVGNLNFTFSNR